MDGWQKDADTRSRHRCIVYRRRYIHRLNITVSAVSAVRAIPAPASKPVVPTPSVVVTSVIVMASVPTATITPLPGDGRCYVDTADYCGQHQPQQNLAAYGP